MSLLLLSIAILAASPFIYRLCLKNEALVRGIDGFIFVSMAGLILGDVLPHTVERGGAVSLVFALFGFMGPTLFERGFKRTAQRAHLAALLLGLLGLCLHGALDGVYLMDPAEHDPNDYIHLRLAVVLHRLPAGLTIWWLVSRNYGNAMGSAALGVAALSTVAGYSLGRDLLDLFSGVGTEWFQALVAGSLLHVVHHRPHVESHACTHDHGGKAGGGLQEGLGGLVALVLLVLLMTSAHLHAETAHTESAHSASETFLNLARASAPALLLGYAMAGLLSVFLPASSVRWLAHGSGWRQAFRGMALGLPMPVCSCGVVPLYRSLVERGGSTAAAIAFLVATPEIGIDAVILSVPLLGGPFTALRVSAAALLALITGWLVGRLTAGDRRGTHVDSSAAPVSHLGLPARLAHAVQVGFGEVLDHTGPWILLGLAVAAVAGELLAGSWLLGMDHRIEVLVFAIMGVPVYVCASGATPLVAVLLMGGVSPGAALAFLLTGPATNVTTFGVLSRLHGWRTALSFSVVMLTLSVGLGIATNEFFRSLIPTPSEASVHEAASPLEVVSLLVLAGVFLVSFVRRGPRQFVGEILSPHGGG